MNGWSGKNIFPKLGTKSWTITRLASSGQRFSGRVAALSRDFPLESS